MSKINCVNNECYYCSTVEYILNLNQKILRMDFDGKVLNDRTDVQLSYIGI